MRNVNAKSPDVGGMFLMPTPPMSRDCQVLPGLGAVGREASTTGGTVAEGWLARALAVVGDISEAAWNLVEGDALEAASRSFATPFVSGGLIALGFVMGIAAFWTVRAAMALALARWCGDLEARII